MKWASIASILLLIALTAADSDTSELNLAEPCDEELCTLPDCRCSNTNIPGGLAARDTPQFILLTFDDGVNVVNIEYYRTLYNRRNKNSCRAGISYFVSHEYTNYRLVNELYNQGYEIALHSITHQTPQSYWAEATYETLLKEFSDQILQMQHFANIPRNQIHGIRSPFLQMSGNSSFQMIKSVGLKYDASWGTVAYNNPGLWPYTLTYASTQDCVVPPCPSASFPGTWVLPLISWVDLGGFPCTFVDACIIRPELDDEEGWYRFILNNFERHYLGNRSPFGFYVHEWFLSTNPAVDRAFRRFLDLVNNLHDAFMVNANEVIDWVQNPVKIDEYASKPCNTRPSTECVPRDCGPLPAEHTEIEYWMQVCNVQCPAVYPWLGNPLGVAQ